MKTLDSVLFYYIEKAIKSYRQLAQRELKNAGLLITVDQWLTLSYINEHPDVTQKDLAVAVFKDTASITRIIELLVKAKYIRRTQHKTDRRKSNLIITDSGLEIIIRASSVVNNYRKQALKDIGISKEDHVKRVMKTIINNCQ